MALPRAQRARRLRTRRTGRVRGPGHAPAQSWSVISSASSCLCRMAAQSGNGSDQPKNLACPSPSLVRMASTGVSPTAVVATRWRPPRHSRRICMSWATRPAAICAPGGAAPTHEERNGRALEAVDQLLGDRYDVLRPFTSAKCFCPHSPCASAIRGRCRRRPATPTPSAYIAVTAPGSNHPKADAPRRR